MLIITFIFLDILAINTSKYGGKRAYSINPRGGYEKLNFEFGDGTEVFWSCSLQWKNYYSYFPQFVSPQIVSFAKIFENAQ